MDARLRRARQDWLSQGDVASGVRALDAEDLSPLEALRHPWLASSELRLAYGGHLAGRAEPLGEWIAASTRLEDPEGLSLEEEWELRQREWTLRDAHGERWTGGQRRAPSEFTCELGHRWSLAGGRVVACPWQLTPTAIAKSTQADFRARGEPVVEIMRDEGLPNLLPFANLVAERAFMRALHSLKVALQEEWPWSEEEEAAAQVDFDAVTEARNRAQLEATPPVDLRALTCLLPSLRHFELHGSDFLGAWAEALSPRLESFASFAAPNALEPIFARAWPRLRRLTLRNLWMGESEALAAPPQNLVGTHFPRLEELSLMGLKPPGLGAVGTRLRSLTLGGPVPMMLGGPPSPAQSMLRPVIQSDLPRLRELSIYSHRTSGWLFDRLAELPALRTLELSNTGLDNVDARHVARLRGLRRLSLGSHQPLNGKGLEAILSGPLSRTLRDLDLRGRHGCCGPSQSHYPLGGAQALHDLRGHGLTTLSLPHLTLESARVLATAPALRRLCSLRVGDLRDDPEAIHAALTKKAVFSLADFEVDNPRSPEEEAALCRVWGRRYLNKPDLVFFDFNF